MEVDAPIEVLEANTFYNEMGRDGVIVVKNLIHAEHIVSMKHEIRHIRSHVIAKIATMDRTLKTYTDIAERQLNRLDYRCGFTADIFQKIAEPIIELIKTLSPKID